MRWFSHRSRTWKDTVLKIKIKKKAKGFTLVTTALAVLCWIFIAQAFFMMSSGTLSTVKAERTAYQAEQNTALDVAMYQENSRCTNSFCPWELNVSKDFFVSRQMDTAWAS